MKFKLATLISLILVLSILIPGAATADLDFTVDSDSSQVEVPGTATISGEVCGKNLNSLDIQRYSDGSWEDIGTPEVCIGDCCDIERTHSRFSAADVKFRIEAYVDTETDATYSRSITVDFVEPSDDSEEQDDSPEDRAEDDAYISNLEIQKSSDRLKTTELAYIEGEMHGSELNSMAVQMETSDGWTTVGTPESCYGTSCEIKRSHTRITEGISTFRIEGYDNENPPEYSREVTVEFYEEEDDEDDGYEKEDSRVTDISISSSADRVEVSDLVYISGRMNGTRLDRIRVERKTDYGWTTVGTNKDCSGSHCSIERSHSRLSEGTQTFRVVGYDQDDDRLETREVDVEFYNPLHGFKISSAVS